MADPKLELHTLVDRLSDADVATLLAEARRLVGHRPPGHEPPVLQRGRPLASIDELAGDVFPLDERVDEFDATVRRWREEGSPHRG